MSSTFKGLSTLCSTLTPSLSPHRCNCPFLHRQSGTTLAASISFYRVIKSSTSAWSSRLSFITLALSRALKPLCLPLGGSVHRKHRNKETLAVPPIFLSLSLSLSLFLLSAIPSFCLSAALLSHLSSSAEALWVKNLNLREARTLVPGSEREWTR